MSLLNFESSAPASKGKKKGLKIFLGIGALAGSLVLGSTLAANINLNEFKLLEMVRISLENYCELPGDPLQHLLQADGSSQSGETHQAYFVESHSALRWISS